MEIKVCITNALFSSPAVHGWVLKSNKDSHALQGVSKLLTLLILNAVNGVRIFAVFLNPSHEWLG
jgi:hypothetical protein